MAEDSYFLPKGTLILKPMRRSPHLVRFMLAAIMMCSVYISSICLKQTQIQIKPELARTQQTQINQEVMRNKSVEQDSSDLRIVGLDQTGNQTKAMLKRTEPIENMKSIKQTPYNFSVIGLEQTKVEINPELLSIPLSHSSDQTKTQTKQEQHSYDPRMVGLAQAKVKMKPVLERTKPTEGHPNNLTRVGLNQTELQVNPDLAPTQVGQQHCQNPEIPQSELPYVHYPVPTTFSRRECACTPVRFFVIIALQRSGSKWLESLLNSHSNISSNGEIFIDRERSANISMVTKTLDKVYNLDWKNSVNRRRCTASVGFKWMLNQRILTYHEEVAEYFARRGVSVIFLFRRNLLRRLISLLANSQDHKSLNGDHKAHIFTQHEADLLASYKPYIHPKSLVRKLRLASFRTAEAIKHFNSLHHMVLYYEDLVLNNTKLTDVMEFLRVPQRQLHSQHVKIHTKPISEMVRNWSAVRKALKGTEFARFLSSDY